MNELYYHGIDPNDYNIFHEESIASARDKLREERKNNVYPCRDGRSQQTLGVPISTQIQIFIAKTVSLLKEKAVPRHTLHTHFRRPCLENITIFDQDLIRVLNSQCM